MEPEAQPGDVVGTDAPQDAKVGEGAVVGHVIPMPRHETGRAGTPEGAGLHTVDHCTRSIPSDNGYCRSGVSMKIRVTTGTVWPSRVSSTMS